MARTISQIYEAIITEKESNAQLSSLQPAIDSSQKLQTDLTSTSQVAIWRLIYYTVAVAIWVFEKLLDLHTAEINAREDELIQGTLQWYADTAKEFQLGDTLTWNGTQFTYATIDTTKQIVAFSAVDTQGSVVVVKVAKDDGTGEPTPLLTAEKTAFTAYLNTIRFAGTDTLVISDSADLLKLAYTIVYDPLVLASDGSLLTSATTFPVENAINDYIINLPFDGTFKVSALTDAIQAAIGVLDAIATTVQAKYGSVAYTDILLVPKQEYTTNAGYLKIDPSFPLSTQLTYTT